MCQNMPTIDARMTPIRPMNANCPTPARLRFVVVPKSASAPNIPAVTTNVDATEAPV